MWKKNILLICNTANIDFAVLQTLWLLFLYCFCLLLLSHFFKQSHHATSKYVILAKKNNLGQ
jgi:hypothetical protein